MDILGLLIYSYRVRYNGLLASLFLSSLGTLLRKSVFAGSAAFWLPVFNP